MLGLRLIGKTALNQSIVAGFIRATGGLRIGILTGKWYLMNNQRDDMNRLAKGFPDISYEI